MPSLPRFLDCEHSVFISYAHADNELNGNWVTDFANEFSEDLKAELSRQKLGKPLPPVHLSEFNGPVAGDLGPQLSGRVARAFAMVVVVDRFYASSEWCLRELQYFKQHFGREGLAHRLYLVALAEGPMSEVVGRPAWRDCFADLNPVWVNFYSDDVERRLVRVLRDDGRAPTSGFLERFDRIRQDLVGKIVTDLATPVPATPGARLVLGIGRPELAPALAEVLAELRRHDPGAAALAPEALMDRQALVEQLKDADTLVLPFNDGQPLYPTEPGGHLAALVRQWKRLGKPDEGLLLLDLSAVPAPRPADAEDREFLQSLGRPRLGRAALLQQLFPPPPDAPGAAAARGPARPVRLYIESNQNEPRQWKLLGEQIRRRWQKLLDERKVSVPLSLRPSGLNVDQIDLFNLDDADGLILLWGQKEARSLLSQINLVEDRLTELAPAIVAYLSPPKPRPERAVPALGWQVLRFNQREQPPPEDLEPEADDEGELTSFLNDVLDRTERRHGLLAGTP